MTREHESWCAGWTRKAGRKYVPETEKWNRVWKQVCGLNQCSAQLGLAGPWGQHSSFPESRVYFLRVMNKQGQNVVRFMF